MAGKPGLLSSGAGGQPGMVELEITRDVGAFVPRARRAGGLSEEECAAIDAAAAQSARSAPPMTAPVRARVRDLLSAVPVRAA